MTNHDSRRAAILALVVVDAVGIAAALLFASLTARTLSVWHDPLSSGWLADNEWAAIFAIPLILVVFAISKMYRCRYLFLGPQEYAQVLAGSTFAVLILSFASILLPGSATVSAAFLLIAWMFLVVVIGLGRFAFRRAMRIAQRRGYSISRALIIGVNEQTRTLAQTFTTSYSGVSVLGFIDDDLPVGTHVLHELSVLGSPRSVPRLIREYEVDQLIIVHEAMTWESLRDILEQSAIDHNEIEIKILPGFHEILTTGIDVHHTGFVPLLALERVRITGFDAVLKNVLDYGLSVLTVMLVGPLMAAIALMLPMLGPGPILQRDRTYGQRGVTFNRLSFNLHARLRSQPGWRGAVVRAIRRGRIEMLPQVFNVLRGHMSWVGPRAVHTGNEQRVAQWLPNLLMVKPGITGPWAIAASARGSMENEIRGALYYVRNYSIWLDLQILFHTARNLLRFHPNQLRLAHLDRIPPARLETVHQLAESLVEVAPASACCISVWDDERQDTTIVSVFERISGDNGPEPSWRSEDLSGDLSIYTQVMNGRRDVLFEDLSSDAWRQLPEIQYLGGGRISSGAILPLRIGGVAIGCVFLANYDEDRLPSFDGRRLAQCRHAMSEILRGEPPTWRSNMHDQLDSATSAPQPF